MKNSKFTEPSDDLMIYFTHKCGYYSNFEVCGKPAVSWYITRSRQGSERYRSRCNAHGPESMLFLKSGLIGESSLAADVPIMHSWDEVQVFEVLNE